MFGLTRAEQDALNARYLNGMIKELKRRGYDDATIRDILAYDDIVKRAENGDGDVLYHLPPDQWADIIEGGWLYSQGINPCEYHQQHQNQYGYGA